MKPRDDLIPPQKRKKPTPSTSKASKKGRTKDEDKKEKEGEEELESKYKLKLLKNRESASKSRKKKKAIFESLKTKMNAETEKHNGIKAEVEKCANMLEKAYQDNENLRVHVDSIVNENSKLKDEIIHLQQALGKLQSAMYTLIIQRKVGVGQNILTQPK